MPHSFEDKDIVRVTVDATTRTGVVTASDARWIEVNNKRLHHIAPGVWPDLPLWRTNDGQDCTVLLSPRRAVEMPVAA